MAERDEEARKTVSLDDCLRAFAKEEKMDENELWYCSLCKAHQRAAKKLDIWALPPYLIVHLKRFHMHNGRWIKSSTGVSFPLRDLHPAHHSLQSVPGAGEAKQEDKAQHSSAKIQVVEEQATSKMEKNAASPESTMNGVRMNGHDSGSHSGEDEDEVIDITSNSAPSSPSKQSDGSRQAAGSSSEVILHVKGDESGKNSNGHGPASTTARGAPRDKASSGNATSASQAGAAAAATGFTAGKDSTAGFGACGDSAALRTAFADRRYDLYAVVCHEGILGGGHYVAYARSESNDGWYYFNDSACRKVRVSKGESLREWQSVFSLLACVQCLKVTEDVVAKQESSAYVLFYKCRDVGKLECGDVSQW